MTSVSVWAWVRTMAPTSEVLVGVLDEFSLLLWCRAPTMMPVLPLTHQLLHRNKDYGLRKTMRRLLLLTATQ